jgi:phospholipase/carboxylesterase
LEIQTALRIPPHYPPTICYTRTTGQPTKTHMLSFHGPQQTCLDPKALVVLLHGYGSSGEDLVQLAPAFDLPNAFFWGPNAPDPCESYPQGWQWFSFYGSDFFSNSGGQDQHPISPASDDHKAQSHRPNWEVLLPRIQSASRQVAKELVQKAGNFDGPIILAGFSQGAAVAGHLALFDLPVAGVILFSGIYPVYQAPTYRPDVMVLSGTNDPIIPPAWIQDCSDKLKAYSIPTQTVLFEGVDHGICPGAVSMAREFIVQQATAWNQQPRTLLNDTNLKLF